MIVSRPSPTSVLAGLLLVVAIGVIGLTGACRESAPRTHLLLISIDTLRADSLGCYGNVRDTSPAIDALASEGMLFEDASAPSPWTKPSHASLLTGRYPRHNGAVSMVATLGENVIHLAEWLRVQGYATAAVVNSQWLTSHGLERGFDTLTAIDYVQGRRAGSPVTEQAIAWLARRNTDRPFALMVHYMDVHSDYTSLERYEAMFVEPYDGPFDGSTQQLYRVLDGSLTPNARDVRHLRNLYEAGVRQLDERIERLLAWVRSEGLLENTVVVLTSDHGEEFLEHGRVIHGFTQFQEVVQVPLIVRGPGVPAARRNPAPASLIDVVPTVLDLMGLPAPRELDGRSLRSSWAGDGNEEPRHLFFEADVMFPPPGPGPTPPGYHRAVRNDRFKLHLRTDRNGILLYDLTADPAEQHDVTARHPDVVSELRTALEDFLSTAPQTSDQPFDDEALERLRSLGYVQ